MSNVPGIGSVMLFVVSVIATFVYVTCAISSDWPGGQEKLPSPGGEIVRLWEIVPFFPELKVPVSLTGSVTVVLF